MPAAPARTLLVAVILIVLRCPLVNDGLPARAEIILESSIPDRVKLFRFGYDSLIRGYPVSQKEQAPYPFSDNVPYAHVLLVAGIPVCQLIPSHDQPRLYAVVAQARTERSIQDRQGLAVAGDGVVDVIRGVHYRSPTAAMLLMVRLPGPHGCILPHRSAGTGGSQVW